jgi:N-acetyl-gamma-glutamyl-phosphate reductase
MHIYSQVKTYPNSPKNKPNESSTQKDSFIESAVPLKVAVVGARGYSGLELFRILLQHPHVGQITLGINEQLFDLENLVPESLTKPVDAKPVNQLIEEASQYHLFFLATPAEVSMELAPQLLNSNIKVIDLSGAFRLSEPTLYQKWYNIDHSSVELLPKAHFGLSPLSQNNNAQLIANPGCYATSVLMAIVPLIKEGILDPKNIVIDAKSGTTGAGKKASENLLFSEIDGECLPYRISKHQHLPEICEHVFKLTGQIIEPMFATSLLPVRRGIISGIYGNLLNRVNIEDVTGAYNKYYSNYPLIKFAPAEKAPHILSLKRVVGSAKTQIGYVIDQCSTGQRIYLYSSIDNLLKGAASQAIENMNYLWGWPIESGLLYREGVL